MVHRQVTGILPDAQRTGRMRGDKDLTPFRWGCHGAVKRQDAACFNAKAATTWTMLNSENPGRKKHKLHTGQAYKQRCAQ